MSDLTMKLLLVEDNPTDALLLEEALNEVPNLKFQLAHVARLDEGMKALESHKFDAVLLDLGLPDSQGLATLAKMQKRHPNVPILVLTGLEDATLAVNAVRAGAQDYLTKGKTNGTMLAVTIRYAIERKRTDALLHERAQFQRTLLENFPNGSVNVLDRDLRYVVAEGRDLVAPSDSLVGKSLEEIFAPAQAAEARSNYQKVLAGECVDFEMCNDGRWWSVSAAPLPSVHGEIETILSIAQDMTARKEAEDERDRFFTLSLDLLGIATLDGHWIRVNPAFSEHLGFSSEEIMASPIIDLVHPDDVAATIHRIGDLASGKTVIGFENRYRTNLGTWRNLEWKGVSRPDAGLMYCAARDVTDRKLSEEALRKAHTTLETRVRVRTAELAKANVTLKAEIVEREAAEAETRYRARQQEAVAELGRRALLDVDMDTLLSGATSLVTATLGADLSTFLAFAPDRRSLRVRAGSGWKHGLPAPDLPIPMTTQAGYSLLSKMPTIVTDMTTETRFDRSKSLIQEGLVSGVTVIVGNPDHAHGTLGAHSTSLREFTRDDIHFLQSMANVLAAVLDRDQIETAVRDLNAQLNGTNEQLKIENLARQMALNALSDVTVGLKSAKEDAETAMEVAEVASRAKSEFLSRMSHELRTPLNAILGFGQILAMRCPDEDRQQTENIQQIIKAGRHLLELINEVLDIARIEAGHLSLSPEPVATASVIEEAMSLMQSLASAREIRLEYDEEFEQASLSVLADQQRLKQILLNFLSNAVKYNREGGQVILSRELIPDMSGPASAKGPDRLRITVRDTGPGLSPEQLGRLFVPFERLGAEDSKIEGTGIGLSLCKRLAEAMNGQVGVKSQIGLGSNFWVELPLAPYVSPVDTTNAAVDPESSLKISVMKLPPELRRTILYIEDNLSNIELIEWLLLEIGGEIRLLTAMQGSLGLDLAVQHQPDLILLDVNLPDLPGEAVLRRLKSHSATQDIPVLVLSADATPRQIERMTNAGAVEYLTKPLDVERFCEVIQGVLLKEIAVGG